VTERGRIREIKGNIVIIAPDKSAACFGCMNLECKSGDGLISAENPGNINLEPGQMVEVEAAGVNLAVQAIAAFLPPLLGLVAGYTLIRFLFPRAGEGAAAFTGMILLFAAAFVVYRIRKKKPGAMEFTVTRIIS